MGGDTTTNLERNEFLHLRCVPARKFVIFSIRCSVVKDTTANGGRHYNEFGKERIFALALRTGAEIRYILHSL
jgi:hypothetical protein